MAEASTMHKRGFKKLKEIVDIEFEVLAVAHHDELVAGNAICPCEVYVLSVSMIVARVLSAMDPARDPNGCE
jgi:hypothetical protein